MRAWKGKKGSEIFVISEKKKIFNRLLGLEEAAAYKSVGPQFGEKTKKVAAQPKTISAERAVDLKAFNK